MGLWGIGFLFGAIMALVFTGIGVIIGDYKDTSERDTDVRIYIPVRHRHRSRTERVYQPTSEEITDVLCVMRLGASDHEKDVIDYLISKEEGE